MVEFDPKIPIYIQIIDAVKHDIVTGKLKGGDKLPSVRELAETFKVNPNTVQRVYQELEREGITYTQRGTGTFITEEAAKMTALKKDMAKEVITSFIESMKKLGFAQGEILDAVQEYVKEEEQQ